MSMKSHTFRAIIETEETQSYHTFFPLLKGLHTYGRDIAEVKKNLKEAIICHVQGLLKDKKDVPQEEDTFELIQSFSGKEIALAS